MLVIPILILSHSALSIIHLSQQHMTYKKITQLRERLKPGYFFSSLGLGMRLTYMENSITVPPELTVIHRLQQFFFLLLYFGVWLKGISRNPWKTFSLWLWHSNTYTLLTHLGTYLSFSLVFLHLLVTHLHHPF